MRRDKLNDRIPGTGSLIEAGKPPKLDKAAILSDAARLLTQLRNEAKKLKESNETLQEKIKELKVRLNFYVIPCYMCSLCLSSTASILPIKNMVVNQSKREVIEWMLVSCELIVLSSIFID
ncbi:hypothetical protein BHE74_00035735 [Ensete ventricosum]|nr:hypothetical protein BHE74_00035735 [Ensete ventricosum]